MKAIDFKSHKRIHFIGIGGIGMSAIAKMLLLEGKRVTGSDLTKSIVTEELKKHGAKITFNQKKENVKKGTDLVIYTIAITSDNPELTQAKKMKIQLASYPEVLGVLSKEKFTVAISGTHGKTTTSAMIASILIAAKLDPTVVVGSLMTNPKAKKSATPSNFIAGKGNYFVVEACEYKRSFLNLTPKILVITNIDNDHMDYYSDLKDIQSAFAQMADKLEKNDYLVCDVSQKNIKPILKKIKCKVIDYGGIRRIDFKLKVPGEHNVWNAKAALAVAQIVGVPKKIAKKALEDFTGTWRRFEHKGKFMGAFVYDDYAHHPTEIKATLAGARALFPKKSIVVVFQPHLYSRTKLLRKDFGRAFEDADAVFVAPIYAAREPDDPEINSEILVGELRKHNVAAMFSPDFEKIKEHLSNFCASDILIITMGAGDIYKLAESLIKKR